MAKRKAGAQAGAQAGAELAQGIQNSARRMVSRGFRANVTSARAIVSVPNKSAQVPRRFRASSAKAPRKFHAARATGSIPHNSAQVPRS